MSDRTITAIVTFFSGLGVIIGVVLVVYTLAYLADRFSCASSGALTAEEYEERQNASLLTIQSGLAGLLTDERNKIYRVFFDKQSFPYHKPPEEEMEDLEAQTQKKNNGTAKEEPSNKVEDQVSDELSIDDADAPSCSICLNEYHNGDKVILGSACSHMFHYDCCMQWVDKGNEHCPYCRKNMISAKEFSDTALDVVGEERVNKLKRINEEAAVRLAALSASGAQTIPDIVPPVGQAPSTQTDVPVVSTPEEPSPAPTSTVEQEAGTTPQIEEQSEETNTSAEPSNETEVVETPPRSDEASLSEDSVPADPLVENETTKTAPEPSVEEPEP